MTKVASALPWATCCGTFAIGPRLRREMPMRGVGVFVLVAVSFGAAALGQEVDVQKAVHCATLAQQFGDSVKAAEAEDDVKTAATDLVKQGNQACMEHDYDAGLDQLRKALQQIGLKPIV